MLPIDCHWPAVEIRNWQGGAPRSVKIGGRPASSGDDYVAAVDNKRLVLQILADTKAGTKVKLGK